MAGKFELTRLYALGTYGPIYFGVNKAHSTSAVLKFFDAEKEGENKHYFEVEKHILQLLR